MVSYVHLSPISPTTTAAAPDSAVSGSCCTCSKSGRSLGSTNRAMGPAYSHEASKQWTTQCICSRSVYLRGTGLVYNRCSWSAVEYGQLTSITTHSDNIVMLHVVRSRALPISCHQSDLPNWCSLMWIVAHIAGFIISPGSQGIPHLCRRAATPAVTMPHGYQAVWSSYSGLYRSHQLLVNSSRSAALRNRHASSCRKDFCGGFGKVPVHTE